MASGLNAGSVEAGSPAQSMPGNERGQDRDTALPTGDNVLARGTPAQLGTSGNANGSASGNAASRDEGGVHSSASVAGAGGANVSTQR
jgi:hypothetical protein